MRVFCHSSVFLFLLRTSDEESDEESGDKRPPKETPASTAPKAKGVRVVSDYFSSRDLEIFKASLFDNNGGSFVGSRQRVAQIRRDNPDFDSAWQRMEARKREKYGEDKWDKLPQGKKHTSMINVLRKTVTRGKKQ